MAISDSLGDTLLEALKQKNWSSCIVLLQAAHDSGVSMDNALSTLQSLRNHSDLDEDFVLELMDIVSGWCHPNNKIWKAP